MTPALGCFAEIFRCPHPRRILGIHGMTDMPVWGTIFRALDPSDALVEIRIENLVQYIASIQEP